MQKWFEIQQKKRSQKINEENAEQCPMCSWKSASKSHRSMCQRYSNFLPDKNSSTCPKCGKNFKKRDGLYFHFDRTKCKPYAVNNFDEEDIINKKVLESEPVQAEVKIENVELGEFRITSIEGSTTHYQGDVNMESVENTIEEINDEPPVLIPNNMEFLTQIKFLNIADFSVYFGKLCFKVHRLKLVEQSPVLERIVSENQEFHVPTEDTKPFLEVLKFIYSEHKLNFEPENFIEALKGADKYHLPVMLDACVNAIGDLNDNNLAVQVFAEDLTGIGAKLRLQVKNHILNNFKNVVKCSRWITLTIQNPELVYELFESKKCTNCHPSQ